MLGDVSDGVVLPEESPPPGSDRGEGPRATKRRRFRKRLLPFAVLAAPPADREGDAHSLGAVLRETLRRAARVPVRGKRAELGVQRAEKHNQLLVRRRDGWAGSRLGIGTRSTGSRGNLRVVAEHPPLDQYLFRVAQRVGLEKNLEHHASRRRLGRRLRRVAAPRPAGARRALVRLRGRNCGDQTHPMFDRRARARSVSQERLSRRGGDETRAAPVVRARRSARARFFTFFSWNETLAFVSFWSFWKTRVRTASARARRGDAPIGSSGPSRPRRSVADSARAPAAPQTRTSRTTPRESAARSPMALGPSESICRAQKIPGKPRGRDSGTFGLPRADPPTREGAATGRAHVRTPPNAIAFEVGVGSGKKVARRAARNAPRVARR